MTSLLLVATSVTYELNLVLVTLPVLQESLEGVLDASVLFKKCTTFKILINVTLKIKCGLKIKEIY